MTWRAGNLDSILSFGIRTIVPDLIKARVAREPGRAIGWQETSEVEPISDWIVWARAGS